uniref:Dirigent protein n=1 Tax=Oryza glaberrima TaxID=4538 RepID=I1QU86_ORYGL
MAPSLLAPRLAVPLLLVLAAAAAAAADGVADAGAGAGMTHLHFFFHEVFTAGPNGTTATVAPPARSGDGSSLGFVGVVDDMLREGADPASRLVGRAQGVTAGTSLAAADGAGAITTMLSLAFTEEGPYAGSTLQVFGRAVLGTGDGAAGGGRHGQVPDGAGSHAQPARELVGPRQPPRHRVRRLRHHVSHLAS